MGDTFPPVADDACSTACDQFLNYAAAHTTALGVTTAEVTAAEGNVGSFQSDLVTERDAHVTARTSTLTKRASKDRAVRAVRALAAKVQANPAVTDAMKEALGINPRDRRPTPRPAPTTYPQLTPTPAVGARLTLRIVDSATPTRRARPANADGADRMVAVVATPAGGAGEGGEAAAPPDDSPLWRPLGLQTRAIATVGLDPADAGKTAFVRARWLGPRGQYGPFGPAAAATIAA